MRDAETVVGAIGGLVIGYILWLIAVSIGVTNTTVSVWSLIILVFAVVGGACAWALGWRLYRRRTYPWAAFAFGLPILPVILTLAVLTVAYV